MVNRFSLGLQAEFRGSDGCPQQTELPTRTADIAQVAETPADSRAESMSDGL